MRVFVTGATGVLGRHLVPSLVAAGHEVTASTWKPANVAQLREAGAKPVVLDGLDRLAVLAAVRAAEPEVIVHQMTALSELRSLRSMDRSFAQTNLLRTRGTDNLLEAAAQVGTRRVVAQGHSFVYAHTGDPIKDEDGELVSQPPASAAKSLSALLHVDAKVPRAVPEGIVLRYGGFYGPGASDAMVDAVRKRADAGGRVRGRDLVVHRGQRRRCRDARGDRAGRAGRLQRGRQRAGPGLGMVALSR